MKTTQAHMSVSLDVECPHCKEYFDMFDIEKGQLNDEGQLIKAACPEGNWSDSHKKYEEIVRCPECWGEIHIKGIAW